MNVSVRGSQRSAFSSRAPGTHVRHCTACAACEGRLSWAHEPFDLMNALLLSSKGHCEKKLRSQVRMCRLSCFYSVKFNFKHFPAFPDSPSLSVPLSPGVIWSSTSARYPTTNKAEANARQKHFAWHVWNPEGCQKRSKVFRQNAQ